MGSAGEDEVRSGSDERRARLDALFDRHLPGLMAFVRVRAGEGLRRREATVDLVQSACYEVLRDLTPEDADSEGVFRHRLYLAAERKIIDRVRYHASQKRRAPGEGEPRELELALRGYSGVFTPSREAAAREELARMEAVLRRLPDDHREVIVLAQIVGLSHAEIAERMDRSEGAVRVLLHRALAKLALEMGPPEPA